MVSWKHNRWVAAAITGWLVTSTIRSPVPGILSTYGREMPNDNSMSVIILNVASGVVLELYSPDRQLASDGREFEVWCAGKKRIGEI
ncbi:hypothetical protein F5Y01DRAFT_280695 [Xylaria sp. FL0043]|nr:hypothetical protein F5Y01DRAFT_280695 [Xylaria sp. FL0043]